ncbi:hypothetical protein DS901_17415 [Loktanella sp. D2R18]|uniref:COG4223 family protein n=1 Tax=Rhodobacterales TaxID=204455 RepID=UPI000DE8ADC0|nr:MULTISPECIES: mitofilin family membrane protein [Rhodobacterales]MDO6590373.1 mitofilin family membrane protein [Yoonia sp. 1_MG-2023]RBW41103.1 hypothetical protein DS901_17415 [Loktanella sp. D2R18]
MAKQPSKKVQKAPENVATESLDDAKPHIDSIPAEIYATESVQPEPAPPEPKAVAPEPTPAPVLQQQPVPEKRASGFIPLLLGGVIAGAIGFGVASLTKPATDTSYADQLATQAGEIDSLRQQIAQIPDVDLAGITTAQDEIAGAIDALESDVTIALDALSDRVTTLENQPRVIGEGVAPSTAAYQAELDALRAQIDDMTNIAETQLEAARAEAAAIEENAALAARNAAGRAALARVQSGLETGAPLGAALGDLEAALGQSAPEALLAVQDGVPTLQNLRETYADAARTALATARAEGVSGEDTGGFGAFLRDQFDVRSTAPREGDDADAILSRAGAAIDAGRLSDALAEIAGLPEVARAEMSDWLARAKMRAAAQSAIDLLSTTLSDN